MGDIKDINIFERDVGGETNANSPSDGFVDNTIFYDALGCACSILVRVLESDCGLEVVKLAHLVELHLLEDRCASGGC